MKKMSITKELREKIERVYKDKANVLHTVENKEVEAVLEAERIAIIKELEQLPEDSFLLEVLRIHCGDYRVSREQVTFDHIARHLNRNGTSGTIGEIHVEYKAKKDALPLEKENLLIKMSYAEDIEELKTLFAQANLVW